MIPGFHAGTMLLHDQADAVGRLAGLGYRGVAIRPRPGQLDPRDADFSRQVVRLTDSVSRSGVAAVIDIDASFIPDATQERGPSLASDDEREASSAIEWVERWLPVAAEIGAKWITFSSGRAVAPASPLEPIAVPDRNHTGECPDDSFDQGQTEECLERLSRRLDQLTRRAARHHLRLALRPRKGDAIATVAQFERLGQWIDSSDPLMLAADVGEMLSGHELPVGDRLARHRDRLACVYLCDRQTGSTADQPIGGGDVAVAQIVRSLATGPFQGPAIVRVDGHLERGWGPAEEAISLFSNLP